MSGLILQSIIYEEQQSFSTVEALRRHALFEWRGKWLSTLFGEKRFLIMITWLIKSIDQSNRCQMGYITCHKNIQLICWRGRVVPRVSGIKTCEISIEQNERRQLIRESAHLWNGFIVTASDNKLYPISSGVHPAAIHGHCYFVDALWGTAMSPRVCCGCHTQRETLSVWAREWELNSEYDEDVLCACIHGSVLLRVWIYSELSSVFGAQRLSSQYNMTDRSWCKLWDMFAINWFFSFPEMGVIAKEWLEM